MKNELIKKIKVEMSSVLNSEQMKKLECVLLQILSDKEKSSTNQKREQNYVKLFLNAKIIEGCSKRTEKYYENVLKFYEKRCCIVMVMGIIIVILSTMGG